MARVAVFLLAVVLGVAAALPLADKTIYVGTRGGTYFKISIFQKRLTQAAAAVACKAGGGTLLTAGVIADAGGKVAKAAGGIFKEPGFGVWTGEAVTSTGSSLVWYTGPILPTYQWRLFSVFPIKKPKKLPFVLMADKAQGEYDTPAFIAYDGTVALPYACQVVFCQQSPPDPKCCYVGQKAGCKVPITKY